ncbi:MAG: hypothetical protein PHP06_07520 [Clostridia bacterium]|nr:hypothetical protein [Clostridia bacterium]
MDIFISELKRQMSAKRFISYILISIILGGLWAWFIIGGRTEGFMMTGCYKGLKGIEAIEAAAKDRNAYAGKMTVDNFRRSGEVFLNSVNEENDIVMNDELLKLAVYADTLIMQDYRLKKMFGDTNLESWFSRDFASHFYENENLYYQNLIDRGTKNQVERELALEIWNEVEKPYKYYGGFEAWRDGAEHIQLFGFVLLIVVGFFSSGIIARDKECGLDEIISTTKLGRRGLLSSKLLIPVIMGFLIYTVGMGTYIAILKHYLPANALETSAQVWATTILPYNLGELMDRMVLFGLIGILTISAFTTFVSSKSKKTSTVMSITVLVIISGFLLSVMGTLDNYPILKAMSLILPSSLVFSFANSMMPVISILGKAMFLFEFNLFISILIFFMSLLMTSWNYIRR